MSEADDPREGTPEPPRKQLTKAEQLEKEFAELTEQLATSDFSTMRARVALILNNYPETRDSDVKLTFKYWELFEGLTPGAGVTQDQMLEMQRSNSLARARATIQNDFGLYQASPQVRKFRGKLEEETRETVTRDIPNTAEITVYCDESGRTQRFASVGSVWVHSQSLAALRFSAALLEWRRLNPQADSGDERREKEEFHFSGINRYNAQRHIDFFRLALQHADFMSFKAVVADQQNSRHSQAETKTLLYQLLLRKGVEHDLERGRFTLPRLLTTYIDAEKGSDELTNALIKQNVADGYQARYGSDLRLLSVKPLGSTDSPLIQLADVFLGAVNRRLNPQESRNYKDDVADAILQELRIDPQNLQDSVQDMATVWFARDV